MISHESEATLAVTPATDDIAAVIDAYHYTYGEQMQTLHLPPEKARALAAENPFSYAYVDPPHGEPYVQSCWPVRSRFNAALPSCYHVPAVFRGAKIEVTACPTSFSRLLPFWPATSFMPSATHTSRETNSSYTRHA